MIVLFVMAAFYVFAGVMHFVSPKFFLKIMPPYIPYHQLIVSVSGLAEILLGIGLLFSSTRQYAAWGIIVLLIAVFPANVYMAVAEKFQSMSPWVRWGRLPIQAVLIWWAYQYTK